MNKFGLVPIFLQNRTIPNRVAPLCTSTLLRGSFPSLYRGRTRDILLSRWDNLDLLAMIRKRWLLQAHCPSSLNSKRAQLSTALESLKANRLWSGSCDNHEGQREPRGTRCGGTIFRERPGQNLRWLPEATVAIGGADRSEVAPWGGGGSALLGASSPLRSQ